jgi:hypothetical protein
MEDPLTMTILPNLTGYGQMPIIGLKGHILMPMIGYRLMHMIGL